MKKPVSRIVYTTGLLSALGSGAVFAQQPSVSEPVGQEPQAQETQPEVQAIADYGGVLTPRGRLILEPEFQYSHESINRTTFEGVGILNTLLIGVLSAQDVDRDTYTTALTGRLGVTDRLEMEMKVPYVFRDESERISVPIEDSQDNIFEIDRTLSNNGLGDIELAAHYQLNRGGNGMPFFIGNLRYKSTTGEGPFDIQRNSEGIPEELPTGSGFHSIEPSLTVLVPSSPAVYFANLGYVYNIDESVDQRIASEDDEVVVDKVDPGDVVRLSFGMAYSINPRSSLTLGYKNDFVGETTTTYRDDSGSFTADSNTLNVGSMLLGWSYQVNQDISVNLGLELGITEDAPDTTLTLKMPIGATLF